MNFLIIFGMIGSNMFYVLTGIFSLILRVKSKKRIQHNIVDNENEEKNEINTDLDNN